MSLQHCNYTASTPFYRFLEISFLRNLRPSNYPKSFTNLADVDLIFALDAGTSGVRTVAFDPRSNVVASSYRALTQHFPHSGEVEHDALEIAALAIATLREVASSVQQAGHRVLAVGVTNQRETTIAFDRATAQQGHRAIVWQDRRTARRCEELDEAGHGPLVRSTTGLVLDSYFSATKMRWFLDHGVLDDFRVPSFATVDTWLLWWLTGGVDAGVFSTEPSNASRTMLMDLATMQWSPSMLELFGVERHMLADILPSTSNFGTIRVDVVPELAGVAITGVLGDQQSALFGQACFEPGVVKATYGTGAFILANAGEAPPGVFDGLVTTVAWDLGDRGPRAYAVEGSAFVAGAAVQWLRDELGFIASSDQLEALALGASDSGGVQFVPAFTGLGSPFWRSEGRGSITGLSRGAGRAQIARALIESLAYQVRAMTDAFATCGLELHELRADGGAAAMDLLLQLQATNSRLAVLRSTTLEATARGAATVAGLGCGHWKSLEQIATLWSFERRFNPQDPLVCDVGYRTWLRAVERS